MCSLGLSQQWRDGDGDDPHTQAADGDEEELDGIRCQDRDAVAPCERLGCQPAREAGLKVIQLPERQRAVPADESGMIGGGLRPAPEACHLGSLPVSPRVSGGT